MDFVELDAIEGLRWSWNSWPVSKPESNDLVIPLSIMQTPLMNFNDLPLLPYDPLICSRCNSVLNPYARVDYPSRIWICPFCYQKNSFPRSYAEIGENNIPAELFPTYSTVEYQLGYQLGQNLRINSNPIHNWGTGTVAGSGTGIGTGNGLVKSNSSSFSSSSLSSLDQRGVGVRGFGTGPVFVFVVDCSSSEDELRSLKNELLLIVAQLPENAIVGLIVFDSVVRVYDLGFTECLRVVVFHGERKLSSSQIIDHLGIHPAKLGKTQGVQKHSFILPVSECEFIITTAIEDIHHSLPLAPGHRAPRCTGVAIQVAVALLEGSALHTGSRVMVFTSGPATMGSGMVVSHDLNHSIRTHRDVNSGHAPFYWKSREFYKQLSGKLMDSSVVLDLFACSLDQIGVTEMRDLVEKSGGFIMMAESFESDQFKKCLRHIFRRDENGFLNMCFDVSIEIITTKDVKIRGAIGPCVSLRKKTASVSENEVGEGGTTTWKLGTVTDKTCIAFFFEVSQDQKPHPGTAFFVQFITKYRHGNMGIRKRVTSAARRWVSGGAEIASGFDQETAAAVMARLAVHETEKNFPREVVRWLDKELIRFASKFGDYIPEDPSSFRLSTNFSLYPQFMYHLRRSQFIDVFNSSPDETAFFQVMLNREGVIGSLLMIQPSLSRYSFDGPPVPVLLDVCSLSPDVILLFDSYFYVVIHYGSKIAQWKKMGYDRDPNHESFRKLLEAPEVEAEQVVGQRIPVPKLVKCDQHSSQARFLLAKLNPSATHKSGYVDGSEVIMTDDVSLQVFIEHLQELAVQG